MKNWDFRCNNQQSTVHQIYKFVKITIEPLNISTMQFDFVLRRDEKYLHNHYRGCSTMFRNQPEIYQVFDRKCSEVS